jgi:hypothetical protein
MQRDMTLMVLPILPLRLVRLLTWQTWNCPAIRMSNIKGGR